MKERNSLETASPPEDGSGGETNFEFVERIGEEFGCSAKMFLQSRAGGGFRTLEWYVDAFRKAARLIEKPLLDLKTEDLIKLFAKYPSRNLYRAMSPPFNFFVN